MKFEDIAVYKDSYFSIGQELESGRYYLAIPVNNGIIDYDECYELTPDEFREISDDIPAMEALAEKCRRRENDDRLIWQPSIKRGSPWIPRRSEG